MYVGRDLPLIFHLLIIQNYCANPIIMCQLFTRGISSVAQVVAQRAHPLAGRLACFVQNWEVVTQDHWVLQTITGFQIKFLREPFQSMPPNNSSLSSNEQELIDLEVESMLSKGAIKEIHPPESQEGFYSNLFLVPKKDGGTRPVINLNKLNEFIPPQHFKMEGIHTLKDLLRENDWLTKVDLKDAYFMVPIHEIERKYLRFQVKGSYYQFTCLPFGLSCAPWVFTRTLRPVMAMLRELGVRLVTYIDDILVMADSPERSRDHTLALIFLLENLGFIENQETEGGGQQIGKSRATSFCSRCFEGTREDECSVTSCATSASFLQTYPEGSSKGTSKGQPMLQRSLPTFRGGEDRSRLVGTPSSQVEWEVPPIEETGFDDRIRRLPHRVGSHFARCQDGGPLVPIREDMAHKLPRTTSCYTSSKNIPQRSDKQTCLAVLGQHDCSSIHQQPGWDSIPTSNHPSKRSVDVVPGEGYYSISTTPTMEAECDRGSGVKGGERPIRLDAKSKNILANPGNIGSYGGGPICISANESTASVLQLETRPSGRSNRCIPPGLEKSKGFCQPSLEPSGKGPGQGKTTGSKSDTSGSHMDISTMVPPASEPTTGPPAENPTSGRSAVGSAARILPGNSATTSRVAYLRKHYSNQGISEEATTLLLNSWRTKSAQFYDSLCKRWISWCDEWGSDPIHGPIEEIVNFLAHLFSEGYQYRSLNAYRSAIASIHVPIDGMSIGQHPMVTRLLKKVFHARPPLPRYSRTWDISTGLVYLSNEKLDQDSSLKSVTLKTVMLLALSRPSRSVDLSKLDISAHKSSPEGFAFLPTSLSKQSRQGKPMKEFFFPRFEENLHLCPVQALELYISKTKSLRTQSLLFISFVKPHGPVISLKSLIVN